MNAINVSISEVMNELLTVASFNFIFGQTEKVHLIARSI